MLELETCRQAGDGPGIGSGSPGRAESGAVVLVGDCARECGGGDGERRDA